MRPLPHPPEAEEHPDSIEVLRGWIVNGEFSNPIPLSFGRRSARDPFSSRWHPAPILAPVWPQSRLIQCPIETPAVRLPRRTWRAPDHHPPKPCNLGTTPGDCRIDA